MSQSGLPQNMKHKLGKFCCNQRVMMSCSQRVMMSCMQLESLDELQLEGLDELALTNLTQQVFLISWQTQCIIVRLIFMQNGWLFSKEKCFVLLDYESDCICEFLLVFFPFITGMVAWVSDMKHLAYIYIYQHWSAQYL